MSYIVGGGLSERFFFFFFFLRVQKLHVPIV